MKYLAGDSLIIPIAGQRVVKVQEFFEWTADIDCSFTIEDLPSGLKLKFTYSELKQTLKYIKGRMGQHWDLKYEKKMERGRK